MRASDLLGDQVLVTGPSPLGWATAGTASEEPIFRAPFKLTVTGVWFVAGAALDGTATNFATLSVVNKGLAGAGTTAVASLAIDTPTTDALADGVAKIIPVTATLADREIDAGEILVMKKAVDGTGAVIAVGGVFIVHYHAGQSV